MVVRPESVARRISGQEAYLVFETQSDWRRANCPDPNANLLLQHLPAADRIKLGPHLEAAPVCRGTVLFQEAECADYVYFPQGPLISLQQVSRIEIALIGREGVAGWPALAGCARSPYRAIVRGRDGNILKIRTETLMRIASASSTLGLIFNRFITVISLQMAETLGAHASHRVDMRVARWLLLRHDRVGGDEILVHHDEIAENVGARRASITDCLHVIEGDGLVRCRRGRISIRDRSGLEALAAGCYGTAEASYREVIGNFGKATGRKVPGPLSVSNAIAAAPAN